MNPETRKHLEHAHRKLFEAWNYHLTDAIQSSELNIELPAFQHKVQKLESELIDILNTTLR